MILGSKSIHFTYLPMIRVLGLSNNEARFAAKSFGVKVVLFWLFELLICNLDQETVFCGVVGKGFVPCLLSFAVMDLIVIPRVRRRLRR
jgi:hypothetical protein